MESKIIGKVRAALQRWADKSGESVGNMQVLVRPMPADNKKVEYFRLRPATAAELIPFKEIYDPGYFDMLGVEEIAQQKILNILRTEARAILMKDNPNHEANVELTKSRLSLVMYIKNDIVVGAIFNGKDCVKECPAIEYFE